MPIVDASTRIAAAEPHARHAAVGQMLGAALLLLLGLGGCAGEPAAVPATAMTAPRGATAMTAPRGATVVASPRGAAVVALPLDAAVDTLARTALDETVAALAASGSASRRALVIDPLIDRATGQETAATRRMAARVEALVRDHYPQLEVVPFRLAALDAQPLVLLGAITPVAAPGSLVTARGDSETFRIWAVVGDLRTGLILSHPTVWVTAATVDATPVTFAALSPVWTQDPATAAYLRTCARDPGQAMDPAYLATLRAQALIAEGTLAFEAGAAAAALGHWQAALALPGGRQQRSLNGVYLAQSALGRPAAAEAAFGAAIGFALERDRLAVKLLFAPGGTQFVADPALSRDYPMWLRRIGSEVAAGDACLLVVGHASVSGAAAANEALSLARARRVQRRLAEQRPALAPRLDAEGRGEREPIVGSGTDDLRDALDRRVEFAPVACATRLTAAAGSGAG